jgi:hypothetical protein
VVHSASIWSDICNRIIGVHLRLNENKKLRIMTDKINPETNKNKENTEKEGDKAPKKDEAGGPSGLEPTRYGDWERKGICYDF